MILKLPDDVVDNQKDKTECKYLAVCPTMHWPQDISWDLDIVYNVIWSLLSEVDRLNCSTQALAAADGQRSNEVMATEKPAIRSILLSGIGTGTGNVPPTRFARQFAMAIKNFDDAVRKPEKWSSLEWEDVKHIIEGLESTWSVRAK